MARYLRSTTTGVVMPYNKQLETRPNVQALTDEEADAYDVKVGKLKAPALVSVAASDPVTGLTEMETRADKEAAESRAEIVAAKQAKKAAKSKEAMAVADVSDGEPTAAEVLAALETG